MLKKVQICLLVFIGALASVNAYAGAQIEEPLSDSVKAMMQRSISDKAVPTLTFATPEEGNAWLNEMSKRLERRIPDTNYRRFIAHSSL